jgi:hypothetical protein
MNRLFTFGCSFTQYWRWPTWADLLGRQYNQFENWGLCGAGNSYIFYSLIECHQRHHLSRDDTVYIMWSNTSREDRYVKNRWIEGGNVYWDGHPLGREYAQKWSCERGYLIRDLANITACVHLLDSWQCHYKMFSMVPLHQTNYQNDLGDHPSEPACEDSDVRKFYHATLEKIEPSVLDVIFQGSWFTGTGILDVNNPRMRDFHPTPIEHMQYLEQVVPDLVIPHEDRDWMQQCNLLAKSNDLNWQQPSRPEGRL